MLSLLALSSFIYLTSGQVEGVSQVLPLPGAEPPPESTPAAAPDPTEYTYSPYGYAPYGPYQYDYQPGSSVDPEGGDVLSSINPDPVSSSINPGDGEVGQVSSLSFSPVNDAEPGGSGLGTGGESECSIELKMDNGDLSIAIECSGDLEKILIEAPKEVKVDGKGVEVAVANVDSAFLFISLPEKHTLTISKLVGEGLEFSEESNLRQLGVRKVIEIFGKGAMVNFQELKFEDVKYEIGDFFGTPLVTLRGVSAMVENFTCANVRDSLICLEAMGTERLIIDEAVIGPFKALSRQAVWATDTALVALDKIVCEGAISDYGSCIALYKVGKVVIQEYTCRGSSAVGNVDGGQGPCLTVNQADLVEINTAVFEDNVAKGAGGAVYLALTKEIILSKVTCQRNTALAGGCIALHEPPLLVDPNALREHGVIEIVNCLFSENKAGLMGGAVMVDQPGLLSVVSSEFEGNMCKSAGCGIFIQAVKSADITGGCIFSGNQASLVASDSSSGGAVYADGIAKGFKVDTNPIGKADEVTSLVISDTTFTNNSAYFGGALYVQSTCLPKVNATTFEYNSAQNGGAYFLSVNPNGCDQTIPMFRDNTELASEASRHDYVLDAVFRGNSAAGVGGGLLVDMVKGLQSEVHEVVELQPPLWVFKNVEFDGNTAVQSGGAMAIQNLKGVAFLTNVTSLKNSAENGGALAMLDPTAQSSFLHVINSTATGDSATFDGGFLYAKGPLSLSLQGANTSECAAGLKGGSIACYGCDGLLIGPLDKADFKAADMDPFKVSFTKGEACAGGDVYCEDCSFMSVYQTSFSGAKARMGGAVAAVNPTRPGLLFFNHTKFEQSSVVGADPGQGGIAESQECRAVVGKLSDPALEGITTGSGSVSQELLGLGGSLFVVGANVEVVTSAFDSLGGEIGDVLYVRQSQFNESMIDMENVFERFWYGLACEEVEEVDGIVQALSGLDLYGKVQSVELSLEVSTIEYGQDEFNDIVDSECKMPLRPKLLLEQLNSYAQYRSRPMQPTRLIFQGSSHFTSVNPYASLYFDALSREEYRKSVVCLSPNLSAEGDDIKLAHRGESWPLGEAIMGNDEGLHIQDCVRVFTQELQNANDVALQGGVRVGANLGSSSSEVIITSSGVPVMIYVSLMDDSGDTFQVPSGFQQLSAVLQPVGASIQQATIVGAPVALLGSEGTRISLELRAPPGRYPFKLQVPQLQSVEAQDIEVIIRPCWLGEAFTSDSTCQACSVKQVSVDINSRFCHPCPDNAICPGGAVIIPRLGYWHSSPLSLQVHKCRNPDACVGRVIDDENSDLLPVCYDQVYENCRPEERTRARYLESGITVLSTLQAYQFNDMAIDILDICPTDLLAPCARMAESSFDLSSKQDIHMILEADNEMQCAKGYQGPLCGECSDGEGEGNDGLYGVLLPLVCRECSAGAYVGLVLSYLASLLLLLLVIYSAMQLNESGRQEGPAMSDIYRQIVLLLQLSAIVLALDQSLPSGFQTFVAVLQSLVAPSELGLGCLYNGASSVPVGIQTTLVKFASAVGLMLLGVFGVILLRAIMRVKHKREMRMANYELNTASFTGGTAPGKLAEKVDSEKANINNVTPTEPRPQTGVSLPQLRVRRVRLRHFFMALAVNTMVLFFPKLAAEALGMFSCVRVDSETDDGYALFTHPNGYWVKDMSVECFEGNHLAATLTIGILGTLLVCIGFPLFIAIVVFRKRYDLGAQSIQEWHLYLYHAYREKRCCWEAYRMVSILGLIALQVLLVDVAPILRFQLALIVIAISLLGLVFARPFQYVSLFAWEMAIYSGAMVVVYLQTFVMIPDSHNGIGVDTEGHLAVLYCCVLLLMGLLVGLIVHLVFVAASSSKEAVLKGLNASLQMVSRNYRSKNGMEREP